MKEIIHKKLSYQITGLLFDVHNKLGRYCREKQYGDALEELFKDNNIKFVREKELPIELVENQSTNKADFIIEDKIVLELKTKPIITREDYYQIQRYLQAGNYQLGLLINFQNKYLHPIRVIRTHS